jgi:hypothetical protein
MYSVFKYQVLSTTVENKTFSKEGLILYSKPTRKNRIKTRCESKEPWLPTFKKVGGDDRNRTCDPLNANQVLSQLSYIPVQRNWLRGQDLNL